MVNKKEGNSDSDKFEETNCAQTSDMDETKNAVLVWVGGDGMVGRRALAGKFPNEKVVI